MPDETVTNIAAPIENMEAPPSEKLPLEEHQGQNVIVPKVANSEQERVEEKQAGKEKVRSRKANPLADMTEKAKDDRLGDVPNESIRDANMMIRKAKDRKPFVNPTRLLTPPSAALELFDFEQSAVEHWIRELDSNRLVLLRCIDEHVLYSAAHAIASVRRSSSWETNELTFGSTARIEGDVSIADLYDSQIGSASGKTLVVVFAYSSDSDFFLHSLPESLDRISYVHLALGESRQILVVTSPLRLQTSGRPASSTYGVVPVSFLTSRLQKKFPATWQIMERDLLKQFDAGMWGQSSDEREFHQRFLSLLDSGTLAAEIELRNQYIDQPDPAASFYARQNTLSLEILRDDTPLENTVAFVATHFRRLPYDDFQRVLLKLLGEQTMEMRVAPSEAPRYKPLRQIWVERRQTILKNCKLRIQNARPATVEFEPTDVRDVIEQDFESQFVFLFDDLCRAVETSGLLFDQREIVSDAVMLLTTRRVRNNLEGYGGEFLAALLAAAGEESDRQREPGMERIQAVLAGLSGPRRQHVLNRLAALFNLLLEDRTAMAVDGAIKTLLDLGCHGEVLQLLTRMSHSAWSEKRVSTLRRVLNEGKEEFRAAAYQLLFQWALQGGPRAAILLKNVCALNDRGNTLFGGYTRQLLNDLCEHSALPGTAIEIHPLASALTAADAETRSTLIVWLLSLDANTEADSTMEWVRVSVLTFLWIMPRPLSDDFLIANQILCAWVQIKWVSAFESALEERLDDLQHTEIHRGGLRALAVMDCAVALMSDPGFPANPAAPDHLAAAVAGMERKATASILAHCDAVFQALNICVEVTSFFEDDRASILSVKRMKERWKVISHNLRDFRNRVRQAGVAGNSAVGR